MAVISEIVPRVSGLRLNAPTQSKWLLVPKDAATAAVRSLPTSLCLTHRQQRVLSHLSRHRSHPSRYKNLDFELLLLFACLTLGFNCSSRGGTGERGDTTVAAVVPGTRWSAHNSIPKRSRAGPRGRIRILSAASSRAVRKSAEL